MNAISIFTSALSLAAAAAPLFPELVGDGKAVVADAQKLIADAKKLDAAASIADIEKLFADIATPVATFTKLIHGSKTVSL